MENAMDTIFQIENITNFARMISKGMLDIKDIPRLRKTKGSKQFRIQIDQIFHHTDKYDIAKEYIDSIIKPNSFVQISYGKFLRVISVTALNINYSP